MLPATAAAETWRALVAQGARPAGLGARDTLRLEAGMNLYGNDMDETHHPLESGLAWTVAFEPEGRDFIGRAALLEARARGRRQAGRARARGARSAAQSSDREHGGCGRTAGEPLGEVTSGTFSPTLNRAIALARLKREPGDRVRVDIRGKPHAARIVKPPFVRNGKSLIEIQ